MAVEPAFLSLQRPSGTAQVSGTADPPKEGTKLLSNFAFGASRGRVNLPQCMVRRLTAREKLVEGRKSASMYPACFVEMSLLAMMRYAAYLSFETPRPGKGHLSKQASGAPF